MPNWEVLIDWVSQKTALLWCFNLIKCYTPVLQFHINRILKLFILNSVQLPLCDVHYTVRRNDHKDEWPRVLQTTGSWLSAAAYWKCNSRCADSSPEKFCIHRWRKKTVHSQKTLFWTWTNTEVSKFNETILLSVLPVLPKSITSNVLYKPCSTWGGPCSAMEDEWVHCYHLTNQNVFEGSSIALSDLPLINAVPLWDCV